MRLYAEGWRVYTLRQRKYLRCTRRSVNSNRDYSLLSVNLSRQERVLHTDASVLGIPLARGCRGGQICCGSIVGRPRLGGRCMGWAPSRPQLQ